MLSNSGRSARLTLLVLVVMVLGTAAACGSDDATSSAATTTTAGSSGGDLTGSWTLERYLAGGTESPAPTPAATIAFAADGTFHGTACNTFSGTWTDAAGTVHLTLGPMTQMACVDAALQAEEAAITTGFPKVDTATVSGDTLELTGDGVSFTFARGPEGLVGSYRVTGVNNGAGAVASSAATETMTAEFAADGTVSGNSGCNTYSGTYVTSGTDLTVSDVAGTMRACDEAATTAEQQFLTALAAATTWERSGTTVTLRNATGAAQLVLVPAA